MSNSHKALEQRLSPPKREGSPSSPVSKRKFLGGKLSDSQILRALEAAIDEVVRFEVSDQSPYAHQMRKVFAFKDYLMDFLLQQYGLKSIAEKTYDVIVQRLFEYSAQHGCQYSAILFNCLG